jgi:hypothetical protein
MLDLMCRRQSVSSEDFFQILWGHDINGGPEAPREVINVYLSRIRAFLRIYGVEIIALDRQTTYGPARWGIVIQHRDKARWIVAHYDDLQHAGFPLALSQAGYHQLELIG